MPRTLPPPRFKARNKPHSRIVKERPKQNYGKPKPTGRAAVRKQRKEIAETPSRRSSTRTGVPTFSRQAYIDSAKNQAPRPGTDWKSKR